MPLRSWLAGVVSGAALMLAGSSLGDDAFAQQSAEMLRQSINLASHPDALCNDGSLPIFYIRPGSDQDRSKWVFWLEGGGGCSSDAGCQARWDTSHDLVTSDLRPQTIVGEGILSTDLKVNPDFAGYTHVYVHYCTSDMYAGDRARQINGRIWQFHGAEVVAALLDQLSLAPPAGVPNLAAATHVLITGSSAGARGVHNSLDRIAARLRSARVKGIADAGWTPLAAQPYAPPGITATRRDPAAAFAYLNATPDESCVAANPDRAGDCLNEQFVFPYITTPMLVYADEKDPAIMEGLGIRGGPQNQAERDFEDAFAASVRDSLSAEVPAYFAPDRNFHTVLPIAEFMAIRIGDVTFGDVLHRWYFGQGNLRVAAMGPSP